MWSGTCISVLFCFRFRRIRARQWHELEKQVITGLGPQHVNMVTSFHHVQQSRDRLITMCDLICGLGENVTTYQRDKDMIDLSIKENLICKKDDKLYFELGTVRGSREVTKSTIIIHDFMCWQNEIKYNQTTWNNCSVMQRLSKSQLFFRTVFNTKRQKQDNVNS